MSFCKPHTGQVQLVITGIPIHNGNAIPPAHPPIETPDEAPAHTHFASTLLISLFGQANIPTPPM
ncbi:hypothetical protein FRC09_000544 [Ceratobasidium sp. 395]|nr:hypothetical protein FRC09_000544 [Ceratobasidium sp. 395]